MIDSAPGKCWIVWWDDIQKCSRHSGKALRFEEPTPKMWHQSVTPRKIKAWIKNDFVSDPSVISVWHETAQNTNRVQATTPTIPSQPAPAPVNATMMSATMPATFAAPSVAVTNDDELCDDELPEEQGIDADEIETEDVFDPQSVLEELREDEKNNTYLTKHQAYMESKSSLIGTKVNVTSKSNRCQPLTWIVRDDVKKQDVDCATEYERVGVMKFNFNKQQKWHGLKKYAARINFLELLINLWPGNWKSQLDALNELIHFDNNEKMVVKRGGRLSNNNKPMSPISDNEFWIFWGLILVARTHGRRGNIWDKGPAE